SPRPLGSLVPLTKLSFSSSVILPMRVWIRSLAGAATAVPVEARAISAATAATRRGRGGNRMAGDLSRWEGSARAPEVALVLGAVVGDGDRGAVPAGTQRQQGVGRQERPAGQAGVTGRAVADE